MGMIDNLSRVLADQYVAIGRLRAEIERHIREKMELAGLVAKAHARIERLEALVQEGLQLRERMPITWVERAEAALAGKEG